MPGARVALLCAADAASQEAFCGGARALCTVERIFDQTRVGNHLGIEKGDSHLKPPRNSQDAGVNLGNSRAKVVDVCPAALHTSAAAT